MFQRITNCPEKEIIIWCASAASSYQACATPAITSKPALIGNDAHFQRSKSSYSKINTFVDFILFTHTTDIFMHNVLPTKAWSEWKHEKVQRLFRKKNTISWVFLFKNQMRYFSVKFDRYVKINVLPIMAWSECRQKEFRTFRK